MYKNTILRPFFVLLMGFSYLISVFHANRVLSILINISAIFVVVFYFSSLKKSSKLMIAGLLTLSFILFAISGNGFEAFRSFDTNVGILSLFIFVPLISIPLRAANYLNYIEILYDFYITTTRRLYIMTNLMTYGLSVIMNLGAVTLVYHLTNTASYQHYKDMRYKGLARGYPLAILWSPYYTTMALMLLYFNVSWIELFPVGFVIAGVGIFLGILLELKHNEPLDLTEFNLPDKITFRKAWNKVIELVIIVILLTTIVMLFESWWDISVIPIISIFSIILSVVWTLCYKKDGFLTKQLIAYTQENLAKMGNELTLFISAGVLGQAIISVGAGDSIVYILEFLGVDNALLLILIIMVVTCVLASFGIHPIITITVMAITISSTPHFAADHRIISMGMIASWSLSTPISPFSALTLLLGGLTNQGSLEVGMKRNIKFVSLLFIIIFCFFP